jgi:transcription elongation GreA/GreB family factor
VALSDELKSKTPEEIESWFLGALGAVPLQTDAMIEALTRLAVTGNKARADEMAEMLRETLDSQKDRDGAVRLLERWAGWKAGDPGFQDWCREAVEGVFGDREGVAYAKACGFDRGASAAEGLRRLGVLWRLKPGVFCHDRTWGFGVVAAANPFYEKVTVDFARKPGHAMSFSYAAEVLEIVGDDHLLARKHRDAAGLKAMVTDDPAELVRIALRSFGPIGVQRLRELLVKELFSDADWKPFWDAARKGLRSDPFVEIPARRSEPIRLLDRARGYDEAWFGALAEERDIGRILARVREAEQEIGVSELGPQRLDVIGERLAFAALGARGQRPDLVALAVMAARRLGVPESRMDVRGITRTLMEPPVFMEAAAAMCSRDLSAFLKHIEDVDATGTVALLLDLLVRLPASVLEEAVPLIERHGRTADCVEAVGAALRGRTAAAELLVWACLHHDLCARWGVAAPAPLLQQAVDVLEAQRRDDRLRTLNQIRNMFEDREWLAGATGSMPQEQREALFRRIAASRGWDEGQRRSVLARLVKLYPELRDAAGETPRAKAPSAPTRLTSWRTHRQRQEQLRELLEVTIPQNSREIGQARSYGDLSENFEYQAAKDQQKILMQRQQEFERDLREVRGTDFRGLPTEAAGIGTCVTLEKPGGDRVRLCILGEWDGDAALGIVSCKSRLAEILAGRRPGDSVTLPSDGGEEECRVASVGDLPDDVRAWAAGGPNSGAAPA